MYANQSYFRHRRFWIYLWVALWVFVAALVTVSCPVLFGRDAKADQDVVLSVDDPRPVAKAIEILEAKYGWVITYEDARYVHESEVVDVTEQVRKDLDQYEKGNAPKVIGPKGGRLNISYRVSPGINNSNSPTAIIQMILDTHAASNNPGIFRLEQTGQIFHVVSARVKNEDGRLVAQGSILDATISLPEQERRGVETLGAICMAVSQATQTNIVVGTIPTNLFFQHRSRQGAENETARNVLVRVLESIQSKLSWQLFYDPGMRLYVLNVHMVSKRP